MVQIIEENVRPRYSGPSKKERFLNSMASGIGLAGENYSNYLQNLSQQKQKSDLRRSVSELTGIDEVKLAGLPDETLNEFVKNFSKEEAKNQSRRSLLGSYGISPQMGLQEFGMENNIPSSKRGISDLSDEEIALASIIDPNFGRSLMHSKDVALRERREEIKSGEKKEAMERKEHHDYGKALHKEIGQVRKNLPMQRQAIEEIKTASPGVGIRDFIAEKFNLEPLRTEHGIRLKTGIKDFFLSDLTRAGSRPNQWIEQQLADALPKIGRDVKSNLITAAGLEFKVDLADERLRLMDEIADQDQEKYGYVKYGSLESRTDKALKKYGAQRQKELAEQIKSIKSSKSSGLQSQKETMTDVVRVRGPDGKLYETESKFIEQLPEGFLVL